MAETVKSNRRRKQIRREWVRPDYQHIDTPMEITAYAGRR
ncbi:pyrroloquinoline quinone precursor peptide PqqA [Pseudonocardiaceae bacterium YIM PH 21723]|nr:pyrroloquinoline quinone precursor peptide PqqA [Pseudonocardiaceae bacterium YIM PH 21723]